jgi:hypothetical protein
MNRRTRSSFLAGVLTLGCAGGLGTLSGVQAIPATNSAVVKTRAVRGALAEIARSSENTGLRYGVYLDTMVGPTPEAYLFEWAHPRPWLGEMVSTGLVAGVFGVPSRRSAMPRSAFAIEVGEPYPTRGDTVEIVYDWCVRRFPAYRGEAGPATTWRDTFIPGDTGWIRLRHNREIAASACTP